MRVMDIGHLTVSRHHSALTFQFWLWMDFCRKMQMRANVDHAVQFKINSLRVLGLLCPAQNNLRLVQSFKFGRVNFPVAFAALVVL